MDIPKDLIAASATPLLLSILCGGDCYGYAIIKRVAELSGERITWSEGMLYPVLHRLEKQGLVDSYWQASEHGRRRRYYRITGDGRSELERMREQWQTVNSTLRRSWE
jgi:DNA-binding PadR family transcriptional regulator